MLRAKEILDIIKEEVSASNCLEVKEGIEVYDYFEVELFSERHDAVNLESSVTLNLVEYLPYEDPWICHSFELPSIYSLVNEDVFRNVFRECLRAYSRGLKQHSLKGMLNVYDRLTEEDKRVLEGAKSVGVIVDKDYPFYKIIDVKY